MASVGARHPRRSMATWRSSRSGRLVLALWSRAELAKDAGLFDSGGWGAVALAHNVRSRDEADLAVSRALDAGGRLLKAAAATEWGGYSGYIADPDGHPWEIAWNPLWPIEADGLDPAARLRGDGGEGGIRTRDGLPHTAFPVRRPRPLGDLSGRHDTTRRGDAAGSWTASGGEGGIRTHGAFAHRFSRAAPSTTRTPLRRRG